MSSSATGDIETKVTPKNDFAAAVSAAPAAATPYTTFAIKPEAFDKIVSNLTDLQSLTSDSEIKQETLSDGGTKYSFIDTLNNKPLATLNAPQGKPPLLTLYETPEALAKRIDHELLVSSKDIRGFLATSRAVSDSPPAPGK